MSNSNAMSGLATGAKGNEREQTVHTPDVILDVCREVFCSQIMLDPCASRGHEFACKNLYEEDDGLAYDWVDGTYWNPPYKNLKTWMAFSRKNYVEQIGLFPVRSNRQWWCDYMLVEPSAIAWLKPVLFKGYEKGTVNPRGEVRKADERFPSPLVLVYRGPNADAFESAVRSYGVACAVTENL